MKQGMYNMFGMAWMGVIWLSRLHEPDAAMNVHERSGALNGWEFLDHQIN
jgi:hypothetical protein